MKFYTYLWLREDGTPFYVGKGTGNRSFMRHGRGYTRLSAPPKDRIIIQEFNSEEEAYEAEKFLISLYGRVANGTGTLRNLCDGGTGGPRGEFRTSEHKERLHAAIVEGNKNRVWTDKLRSNVGRASRARREQLIAINKSRVWSEEARWQVAATRRGKPLSEEHRSKISANSALKGKPMPEETRKKISIARRSWSLESVERHRIAVTTFNQRRKESRA